MAPDPARFEEGGRRGREGDVEVEDIDGSGKRASSDEEGDGSKGLATKVKTERKADRLTGEFLTPAVRGIQVPGTSNPRQPAPEASRRPAAR